MVKRKKRNHYLPRFFLKGFCDSNSRVWMYDKNNPTQPVDGAPGDMALIRKLYHLEDSADAKDEIENYFEKFAETPASHPFKKLLLKEFPNHEGKEKLSLFFAMLMVRTPIYIKHIKKQYSNEFNDLVKKGASNKEHFYSVYKKFHPALNDEIIEKDRLSILNDEIFIESNKDFTLGIMLQLGAIIARLLQKMKWVLIETTSELPFIASDNFMNVSNPRINAGFYSAGLGMPDTCVHFPISKSLMLFMVNKENFNENVVYDINNPPRLNGNKINLKEFVKCINKKIFCDCEKYIFANSNSKELKRCFQNILIKVKLIEESVKR